jgi:hypothetical protein
MKKLLFIFFFGAYFLGGYAQSGPLLFWSTEGNSWTSKFDFIGTTDNEPLIFKTNNTERMRLLSNRSYLGIGTSTPYAPLHLHSDIDLGGPNSLKKQLIHLTTFYTGNDVTNGFTVYSYGKSIIFKQLEQDNFHLEGPGGGLMIAPNGNIGVATNNPAALLDVSGSFKAQSATIAGALNAQSATLSGDLSAQSATLTRALNAQSATLTEALSAQSATLTGGLNAQSATLTGALSSQSATLTGALNAQSATLTGALNAQSATLTGALNAQSVTLTGDVTFNESFRKLSIGSAYSSNLSYGTSYIGFNATRDNGNWTLAGDGANNGGAVIWSSIWGDLYFASIPKSSSNGGSTQTLTDAQVKSNIKLQITNTGKLKAKEVQVTLAGWPDFAFEEDYNLLPLPELEQYIKQNSRLPQIPSAAEVEENGLDLGDMQSKLLLKIEELTLYILQQEKKMTDLQNQINELKNE